MKNKNSARELAIADMKKEGVKSYYLSAKSRILAPDITMRVGLLGLQR